MGAGGIGLPNGSFRWGGVSRRLVPAIDKMGFRSLPNGSFRWGGVSRRLVPAIDKMGFRSASLVREE
jgi:hypothetical protein